MVTSTLPVQFPTLISRPLARVSQCVHDWRYVDGVIEALTAQAGAFARAGEATAIDAIGRVRVCAQGLPRLEMLDLDEDGVRETAGLLLEGARAQALDDPDAPATQMQSLTAGTYTCWLDGTGSVTLSDGASGVVTAGNPVTFTLGSTDDVTFTVAGSVTRFQCENSKARTSFIYGASRVADSLTYEHLALPQALTEYTRFIDRGIRAAGGDNLGLWSVGSAASAAMALALFGSTNGYTFRHVGGTTQSVEVATADTYDLEVETRAVVKLDGSIVLGISVSRAAESIGSNATPNALAGAYSDDVLHMGCWNTNQRGNLVLLEHRVIPGEISMASCRSPY